MMGDQQSSGAGNIWFYTAGSSWPDRLISWWTKSPYVHVAIQIDATSCIAAETWGIVHEPLDKRKVSAIWQYDAHTTDADAKDMAEALAWLGRQVGQRYGYSDIATAANLLAKWFYVVKAHRYDCSALATEFLAKAGGVDLHGLEEDPHTVTPGMLATVLKPALVRSVLVKGSNLL